MNYKPENGKEDSCNNEENSEEPEDNKNKRTVNPPRAIATRTEIPRIVAEFCMAALSIPYVRKRVPEGDGHPVIVTPGFMADDNTTGLMRSFLNGQGYNAVGWGQGQNIHVTKEMFDAFEKKIKDLYEETGEKVSLVGQSLGGMFSLIAAAKNPQYVRSVTTLGSPIEGAEFPEGIAESCRAVFEFMTEEDEHLAELKKETVPIQKLMDRLKDIPVTIVYSKGDGIVSPDIAKIPEETDKHRNVEIGALSSHTGMAANLQVFVVIADRLAADAENPEKFKHSDYSWAFPMNIYGFRVKQAMEEADNDNNPPSKPPEPT